ncbi:MAG TPA: ATP-binding protein [Lachnospiraceae bacterium]|nr:ATP-binding protein [Lachnospiraceae bacterium]
MSDNSEGVSSDDFIRLKVPASAGEMEKIQSFIDSVLKGLCSVKVQRQIHVAADEIFTNICSYSGSKYAEMGIRVEAERICLEFRDCGVPFNPLTGTEPDVTLSAEEREIGGLGIFIVKKTMQNLHYEYRNGQNILTMTKIIS